MFPKPRRIKDRALLDTYHSKPCIINNQDCYGDVVAHHIKTRGAFGDDVEENLLALCVTHHREIHSGKDTFFRKYFSGKKK